MLYWEEIKINGQGNAVSVYLKDIGQEYVNISMDCAFNRRTDGQAIINCKDKFISREEIKDILQLLYPTYQDMGVIIFVHSSRWKTLSRYLNPISHINNDTLKNAWKGLYAANACRTTIDLFAYNRYLHTFKNKDKLKLAIVYDLLHEVRHVYQRHYMNKKYKKYMDTYISGGRDGYGSQWIERDANSFAQRMMNKHHDEINKILSINKLRWYNIRHDWYFDGR